MPTPFSRAHRVRQFHPLMCVATLMLLLGEGPPALAQKPVFKEAFSASSDVREPAQQSATATLEAEDQIGGKQSTPLKPDSRPRTPREIYVQTLNAIGYVVTDSGTGTAWVWDTDRRLMVTNDHVVDGAKEILVYFPVHEDGTLQVEPDYYRDKVTPVKATVIDSEKVHDLAIIQLDAMPEFAIALHLAPRSAAPGERVHAIGGRPYGSEGLWKYSIGFVSQVASADISKTGTKVMALQSNIDINPGNSGGPIVNDEGMVAAVAQSFIRDAQSVSYGVDVASIRDYLAKACPLLDSNSPEAKVELANRHRRRGRLDTAMKHLNAALNKDNKSAAGHSARGWTFLEMGDFGTAVADFDKALELDDTDVEAWRGRSLAHRRLAEYDKAYTDISRAIAQVPGSADLYNSRAIIQEEREKYDLALDDYQRAIELDGENPLFLANRADLYLKREQFQQAIADLKRALEFAPRNAWVQSMMGLAYYRLKDYEAADPYFARAVELDDSNAKYVADWGENAQAVGDHEKGIRLWSRAIELNDSSPYAYYSRAWSLRRIEKYPAAIADLDRAIELAGSDAPGFYYQERGLVYQSLGKTELANQDFAEARRIDPETYGGNAADSSASTPSSVVGRWYVNQVVEGDRLEMTHDYRADGTYDAVMTTSIDGVQETTKEQGTYVVHDGFIRFDTNLGKYDQKFKFEDGMFWLFFADLDYWFGSVRR